MRLREIELQEMDLQAGAIVLLLPSGQRRAIDLHQPSDEEAALLNQGLETLLEKATRLGENLASINRRIEAGLEEGP